MFYSNEDWNPLQKRFNEIAKKPAHLQEAKELAVHLHSIVHFKEVTECEKETYANELFDGLTHAQLAFVLNKDRKSMLWNLWHITRIEDLTIHFLVAQKPQILTNQLAKEMKATVLHTGNDMAVEEMQQFGECIDVAKLYAYRNTVGKSTREIIQNLTAEDMKRKINKEDIDKIDQANGVPANEAGEWLLDFWNRKNVAGVLSMPITRHQIVHLNDCAKIRKKVQK